MDIKEMKAKLMDLAIEKYNLYRAEKELGFSESLSDTEFGRYDGVIEAIAYLTKEKYADLVEEMMCEKIKREEEPKKE